MATNPSNNYLNPAAFALPALGTLGNAGSGSIAGPGSWQFDAALSRTFQLRETQEAGISSRGVQRYKQLPHAEPFRSSQQQHVRPSDVRKRPENYAVRFEVCLLSRGAD